MGASRNAGDHQIWHEKYSITQAYLFNIFNRYRRGEYMDTRPKRGILSIVLAYALFSSIWIILSDRFVDLMFKSHHVNLMMQTGKGWMFILVTSVLLYYALRRRDKILRWQQEEIGDKAAQLSTIYDTVSDAIFLHDADTGGIIDCNHGACCMYGYDRISMLTLSAPDIVWRDDNEVGERPGAKLKAALGNPVSFEVRARHSSGKPFWVEVNLSPVTISGRELVLAAVHNIDGQKKTFNAIKRSEEKFSTLFRTCPSPLIISEFDTGICTDFNDSFTAFSGYNRDEVIGHSTLSPEFDFWIEKQIRVDIVGKVRRKGSVHGIETAFRHKDGHILNAMLSSSKINIDGREMMLTVLLDISELSDTRSALANEKERLSVTLRSIGDGVITTSINSTVTFLNTVAEKLTGWQSDDAVGKPLTEVFNIISEITRKPCENPVEKVIATGGTTNLANHTVLISKTGHEFSVADSGAPIRDLDGKIIGAVLVFRDVTDSRKTEEALQKSQRLESLGVLAGGIAHDFNNLLSGIFGYVELAQMATQKGNIKQATDNLSQARTVFNRAKNLTQQLLTFAKGGSPLRRPQSICEHLKNAVTFAVSGSNCSPVFAIDQNAWFCDVDENQFIQVIDNLTINAKQAMPLGGRIEIAVVNVSAKDRPLHIPDTDYVRISIRDHGTGIPPEYVDHVFDPFFTTKQHGSGLGLATAYSIVTRHDGFMELESELGKGAVFNIWLPAVLQTEVSKAIAGTETYRGNEHILVMDDEDFVLDIAGTILGQRGYKVDTAINSVSAVAEVLDAIDRGDPFDAAILDLTIPGGPGGRETAMTLRRIMPNLIIIASSGYANDPVLAKPTEYGFDGCIPKPYTSEELSALVGRLLKNRRNA